MAELKPSTLIRNTIPTIFIVILVVFALVPIGWVVMTSLKDRSEIFGVVLRFRPRFESYKRIFTRDGAGVLKGILNSIEVASINAFICIVVGSMAAYSLSRMRFRGSRAVLYSVLASRLMPPVVVVLPLFLAVRRLDLFDKVVALSILHAVFNLPLCIWLLKSFFDTIPIELEEAAFIDGANRFTSAWRVVFPLARAGIATTALFAFVFSWNEFMLALVFTRQSAVTAPIVLANETYGEAQIFWSDMAALATIIMIPAIILAFIGQKHLVSGLTIGASK